MLIEKWRTVSNRRSFATIKPVMDQFQRRSSSVTHWIIDFNNKPKGELPPKWTIAARPDNSRVEPPSIVSQTNLLSGALVLEPLVVLKDSEDGSVGRLLQWLILLVFLVRRIPSFERGPQSGQHVLLVVLLLLASRAGLSSVSRRHVSLLRVGYSNVLSG